MALAAAGARDLARKVAAIAAEIPRFAIDETVATNENLGEILARQRQQLLLATESTIASAAFDRGDVEAAEALLEALVPRFSDSQPGRLARAWARIGSAERALAIAQKIEDERVRSSAFAQVAIALSEAGQPARALQLLPDLAFAYERIEALRAIVPQITDAAGLERAVRIGRASGIETWNNEDVAIATIRQLVATGAIATATELATSIDRPNVWIGLVKMLAAAGDRERLVGLATSLEIRWYEVHLSLAQSLSDLGEWDAAIALAEESDSLAARSRMLAAVAERLSRSDRANKTEL